MSEFTDGYVAALRESLPPEHRDAPLADETLARIMKDCGEFQARYARAVTWNSGAQFWRDRSRSFYGVAGNRGRPAFPPLAPYLADDGKIYLRDASPVSSAQGVG